MNVCSKEPAPDISLLKRPSRLSPELNEPINHLDIQFQLELMRLIFSLPVTVIVALHDLNLAAKYCQQLVVLHQGQVVASGAPDCVLTP